MVEVDIEDYPMYVILPMQINTRRLGTESLSIELKTPYATEEGNKEASFSIILGPDNEPNQLVQVFPGHIPDSDIITRKEEGWTIQVVDDEKGLRTILRKDVTHEEAKMTIEGDGLASGLYEYEPPY